MNRSPLRYPGGKGKISSFIKALIENTNQDNSIYIEPFAGGAGVALDLLLSDNVESIVINDYDKAIYSFWRAIKEDAEQLLNLIDNTPVTLQEWYNQKNIYQEFNKKYSIELAFATFFLNRTNRSGILKAGPIGGKYQDGKYKLDARFNKSNLTKRIEDIVKNKKRIKVYNKESLVFVKEIIPQYKNGFVYFDPPYFHKGQALYKNFFEYEDHKHLAKQIQETVDCEWIVTYDYTKEMIDLYRQYPTMLFDLSYSAVNGRKKSEILVMKDDKYINDMVMKNNNINLRRLELI